MRPCPRSADETHNCLSLASCAHFHVTSALRMGGGVGDLLAERGTMLVTLVKQPTVLTQRVAGLTRLARARIW